MSPLGQNKKSVFISDSGLTSIVDLKNLLVGLLHEKSFLYFSRPGILVLINDSDWELMVLYLQSVMVLYLQELMVL